MLISQCALVAMIFAVALTWNISRASAAETLLPIKSKIVRCITQQERQNMCHRENLCCNLIDEVAQNETDAARPIYNQHRDEIVMAIKNNE